MSKYHSKKVISDTGEVFDSRLEYRRWEYLQIELRNGRIRNLQRQVKYILIPKQYKTEPRTGKRGQPIKPRTTVAEHECAYYADFVYDYIIDSTHIVTVIEDAKGQHTPEYIIKRKLMRLHHRPITEVTRANQPIQYITSDIYANPLSLQPETTDLIV